VHGGVQPVHAEFLKSNVVFVLERRDSQTRLDPIVRVVGDSLYDPWSEPGLSAESRESGEIAMKRALYPRGLTYPVFRYGEAVGEVTVDSSESGLEPKANDGCTTNHGMVHGRPLPETETGSFLAASPGMIGSAGFQPHSLTATEHAVVDSLARRALADSLPPWALARAHDTNAVIAVAPDSQSATIFATVKADSGTDIDGRRLRAFIILERSEHRWRVAFLHQEFGAVGETGPSLWEFVDLVRLGHDAAPSLVLMEAGYDGYGYGIMRRIDGTWKHVYNGGGGGC
jgi:hypothetical protein